MSIYPTATHFSTPMKTLKAAVATLLVYATGRGWNIYIDRDKLIKSRPCWFRTKQIDYR